MNGRVTMEKVLPNAPIHQSTYANMPHPWPHDSAQTSVIIATMVNRAIRIADR
jgi:hypothetical protein